MFTLMSNCYTGISGPRKLDKGGKVGNHSRPRIYCYKIRYRTYRAIGGGQGLPRTEPQAVISQG